MEMFSMLTVEVVVDEGDEEKNAHISEIKSHKALVLQLFSLPELLSS